MHERWKRLLDEETRITIENVQELGEVIGLVEISTVMDKGNPKNNGSRLTPAVSF